MVSSSSSWPLALCLATSCAVSPRSPAYPWDGDSPIPPIDTSSARNGIVLLPDGVDPALRETFDRYTRLTAPNGGAIHFLAQPGVTDAQLVHAREVMRFYLTDAPGTRFGADKSAVANAMADRRATLVYFESEEQSFAAQEGLLPFLPLFYQDLYADESVVPGSEEYLANAVRDATLEETFHLVHGAGIRWALPEYHAILEDAARQAVRERRWFTNTQWVFEGSNPFEYVVSVIDVFYGLWAHDPHGTGEAFRGQYRPLDRAELADQDPLGLAAVRMFLPDTFDEDCTLAEGFEGTFSIAPDDGQAYTLKSRYLRDVALSGSNDAGLVGNTLDNRLVGNAGDNRIDGGAGHDVVVFSGAREEYEVLELPDGELRVTDLVGGRDGDDTLVAVECLHFADSRVPLDGACHAERRLAMRFASGPPGDGPPEPPPFDLAEHMRSVVDELLLLFDADEDDGLGEAEVTGDFLVFVALADADADGVATRDELGAAVEAAFTQEDSFGSEPEMEVQLVFARLDANQDGRLVREELPPELLEGFDDVDVNGDQAITPSELLPSFR